MQNYANHAHTPKLWLVGFFAWFVTIAGMIASWRGLASGLPVAQAAGLVALGCSLLIGRPFVKTSSP